MSRGEQSEQQGGKELLALIHQQVSRALGAATGPRRVEVRSLWGACYRVNVHAGGEGAPATISSSYFVEVGDDGLIVRPSPPLARQG